MGLMKRLGRLPDTLTHFPVDYSTSFSDIYRNFAKAYIIGESSLDIILQAGCCQTSDFPSWLPDWRSDSRKDVSAKIGLEKGRFKASLDREYLPAQINGDILLADGVYCCTITLFQRENFLLHWEHLILTNAPPKSPSGIPTLQSLLRAFVFDTTNDVEVGKGRLMQSQRPWFMWKMIGFCLFMATLHGHHGSVMEVYYLDPCEVPLEILGPTTASTDLIFVQGFSRLLEVAIAFLDRMLVWEEIQSSSRDGCVDPLPIQPWLEHAPDKDLATPQNVNQDFMAAHREVLQRALDGEEAMTILGPCLVKTIHWVLI